MVKNPPLNVGDTGLIPGSRGTLGEGNGNPLRHFSLGNPTDGGVSWAAVQGVAKELNATS